VTSNVRKEDTDMIQVFTNLDTLVKLTKNIPVAIAESFIFLISFCLMSELMSMASKFLKGGGSLSKAAITTRIIGFPRTAIIFGLVLDAKGTWGLAIVEVASEPEAHILCRNDPEVQAGFTFEVYPMPGAIIRK